MAEEYSPEELAIIEQYNLLNTINEEESEEEKEFEREIRSSRLFNAWLVFLGTLAGGLIFLYLVLADRVKTLTNSSYYTEIFDKNENDNLEKATGLDTDKINFVGYIADNHQLVILGILSFFGALMAFSLLIRFMLEKRRNRNGKK